MNIYPLAINLDDKGILFNREFFYKTPNQLALFLPKEQEIGSCLRLIKVSTFRPGHHLELVMDDDQNCSAAFLAVD